MTRTVTDRPSGTLRVISSARTVSPSPSSWEKGSSDSRNSRPSARRTCSTSRSCSGLRPGNNTCCIIRSASRLKEMGSPVLASKTATPTGDVLIRVSRCALLRCSSWGLWAFAMTRAAWAANITRISSSSWLNEPVASFSAR